MTTINLQNIKEEWLFFLRNSDILTIAERGVITTVPTGTFSSDSEFLINKTNVKNVRSVVVASNTLVYGQDYAVDTDFDDSGTKKCKISFTNPQTGAYIITYDYGSDKIFPDFPKDSLKINSYPRVASDILGINSEPLGFGNQNVADTTDIVLTALVYAEKTSKVDSVIDLIRSAVKTNEKGFYYFKYVRLSSMGPLIDSGLKSQILHRNIDFLSSFNIERN